jgi:hypothetical protein
MRLRLAVILLGMVATVGCREKSVHVDTSGKGVNVTTPGAEVHTGDNGVKVNAPGVTVDTAGEGAKVNAPGVKVDTKP